MPRLALKVSLECKLDGIEKYPLDKPLLGESARTCAEGAEGSGTANGLSLPLSQHLSRALGEDGLYQVRPGWRKQVTGHVAPRSLCCPALCLGLVLLASVM